MDFGLKNRTLSEYMLCLYYSVHNYNIKTLWSTIDNIYKAKIILLRYEENRWSKKKE